MSTAETTGITEGYQFDFEVMASRSLNDTPLDIEFTITDNGGTGATIIGTTVRIQGDMRTATGIVTSIGNVTSDTDITIAIRDTANYNVSAIDPSITVTVKDNDAPTAAAPRMTISKAIDYVADGGDVTFTINASDMPNATSTDVNVSLSGSSFFDGDLVRSVNFDNTEDMDTLVVTTTADSASLSHGIITATILEGAGYVRSETRTENETSIVVADNLPAISITAIDPVDEADEMFTVELVSDIQLVAGYDLTIDTLTVVDANEDDPQYSPVIITNPIEITNTSMENSVDVDVTFTKDPDYEGWDNLTVSLGNSDNYTADPNANSRTVIIREEQLASITVSLDVPISVVEGDDIEVTLTTSEALAAGQSIMVDLDVSNSTGTFLDPNFDNDLKYEISDTNSDSENKVKYMISTQEQGGSVDGAIEFTVMRGNNYEPGSEFTKTVAIQEQDLLPKVTISAMAPTTIEEGETAVFVIAASAVTPPADSITVFVELADATSTGDFLATTTTTTDNPHPVTLASGDSETLSIRTVADVDEEENGSISARITADPKQADAMQRTTYLPGEMDDITAMIMVNDNDAPGIAPTITISADSNVVNEGDDAIFIFTASPPPTGENVINVHYEITQVGEFLDTFTAEDDINITSTGPARLPLATVPDADSEENGTVSIQLVGDKLVTPAYSVGLVYSTSITINDNDDATLPRITISAVSADVTEGAGAQVMFTVESELGSDTSITTVDDVKVEVTQVGNYLAPTDLGTRDVDITAVGTGVPIVLDIINDDFDEEPGMVIARVLTDTDGTPNWSVGISDRTPITVTSEAADIPTLSIAAGSDNDTVNEGDDSTDRGELTFDVMLTGQTEKDVTVKYVLTDSNPVSAVNGTDYVSTVTDLEIESGQSSATITVELIGDELDEDNETFIVMLASTSVNANIDDNDHSVTATINDDDPLPTVSIANDSNMEGQVGGSNNVDLTVTLDPVSGRDVIVNYTVEPLTAELTSDYTLPDPQSITIAAGVNTGTISIPIEGDIENEPDETFRVTLSKPATANLPAEDASVSATAIGTILNDDAPTLAVRSRMVPEDIELLN